MARPGRRADAARLARARRRTTEIPDPTLPDGIGLPEAGEAAARRRWEEFLDHVDDYADRRDLPGTDGTSRMSVHLK